MVKDAPHLHRHTGDTSSNARAAPIAEEICVDEGSGDEAISPHVGRTVPRMLMSRGRKAVISVGNACGVVVAHLAFSTLVVSRAEVEKR